MMNQPIKLGKLTTFQEIAHLSAGQVFDRSLSLCSKKVALIYKGERISYEELNQRVNAFAAGMTSLGFRKGDRCVPTSSPAMFLRRD
jgi:non-ribosomal peptide synthetase component E (peptide arylation enzyme)